MRGTNGAPADSGGGGEMCKSTSDMCSNDTRSMNNTRKNEDNEIKLDGVVLMRNCVRIPGAGG